MEFIKCTHDEIKDFKKLKELKLSWAILSERPKKIEIDGVIVALIDYSFGGIFGDESIEIDSFEVFEKGEGIGSKIIKEFLKTYKNRTISLYPDNRECKKFWVKHGFKTMNEGGEVERLIYNYNEKS